MLIKNKNRVRILFIAAFSAALILTGSVGKVLADPPPDGTPCNSGTGQFFGLLSWDYFLKDHYYIENNICGFHSSFVNTTNTKPGNDNTAQVTSINGSNLSELWLIGLAVFEDLLRIAGFIAVVMVIYGGIRFITSAGDPNARKGAQQTILNALIGLAIAIIAATTISYIGNRLGG